MALQAAEKKGYGRGKHAMQVLEVLSALNSCKSNQVHSICYRNETETNVFQNKNLK